jgi:hypothetical protein
MEKMLLLGFVFVLVPALQASAQTWSLNGNAISSGNFLGTTNYEDLEFRTNNVLGFRISPGYLGTPNVIGGAAANNTGTIGGVRGATIGGGGQSGNPNQASAYFSTVGGGAANTAGKYAATVGGGQNNTASGFIATVSGGDNNRAAGDYSFAAGQDNTASGYSSVAVGDNNRAAGDYSFAAGTSNRANGFSSVALGQSATANHHGTFVWSDFSGSFASTDVNQFLIRASNGVGIGTAPAAKQLHVQYTHPQIRLSDPATGAYAEIGSGTDGLAITTGAGSERLRIKHSGPTAGFVGIGTPNPSEQLHVAGGFIRVDGVGNEMAYIGGDGVSNDVQVGSQNSGITDVALWNIGTGTRMNLNVRQVFPLSTIQEKKSVNKFNEQDYTHALQKLSQLDAVTFLYRDEPDNHQPHIGIIAEDSPQEILNDKRDSINLSAYTTLLLAGLKAQQAEIEQLKSDLKGLQHLLETVTRR